MEIQLLKQIYTRVYSHSRTRGHKHFYGFRRMFEVRGIKRPPRDMSFTNWTKKEWRLLMNDMKILDKLLPKDYNLHRAFCDIETLKRDINI